jgi:hypothetical protein
VEPLELIEPQPTAMVNNALISASMAMGWKQALTFIDRDRVGGAFSKNKKVTSVWICTDLSRSGTVLWLNCSWLSRAEEDNLWAYPPSRRKYMHSSRGTGTKVRDSINSDASSGFDQQRRTCNCPRRESPAVRREGRVGGRLLRDPRGNERKKARPHRLRRSRT